MVYHLAWSLSLSFLNTDYGNNTNIYVPVLHNNLVFRDGKVDISIEKVDELHLHQDSKQNGGELDQAVRDLKDSKGPVLGLPAVVAISRSRVGSNASKVAGKPGDYDGAEMPVRDMHDGRDMFDSTVSVFW